MKISARRYYPLYDKRLERCIYPLSASGKHQNKVTIRYPLRGKDTLYLAMYFDISYYSLSPLIMHELMNSDTNNYAIKAMKTAWGYGYKNVFSQYPLISKPPFPSIDFDIILGGIVPLNKWVFQYF